MDSIDIFGPNEKMRVPPSLAGQVLAAQRQISFKGRVCFPHRQECQANVSSRAELWLLISQLHPPPFITILYILRDFGEGVNIGQNKLFNFNLD